MKHMGLKCQEGYMEDCISALGTKSDILEEYGRQSHKRVIRKPAICKKSKHTSRDNFLRVKGHNIAIRVM